MIIRNHYRAQLTQGCADITAAVENCRSNAQQLIDEGKMLTVALYHYENMLFSHIPAFYFLWYGYRNDGI